MSVLEGLKPQKVYQFFEEICQIPHGSYHVEQISDYLCEFAKKRNLRYIQDEYKNVIIFKEASKGYEEKETIIIQGHMDMVAVAEPDAPIDITKEGLCLETDGEYIYAKGTSLGADDGIAVAYALAILDSEELKHPALEVVITTDEEVGMDGAMGLDVSVLQGKKMLNIDSEEEGIFTAGCAGGKGMHLTMQLSKINKEGRVYELRISGLKGGHSGVMIHYGRGNANCLLGRVWQEVSECMDMYLLEASGGEKGNAIPKDACCKILVPSESSDVVLQMVAKVKEQLCKELEGKEDTLEIAVTDLGTQRVECFDKESTIRCKNMLLAQPDGVQVRSGVVEGLVETSLNMGIMKTTENAFYTHYEIRSSRRSAIMALRDKVKIIGELLGAVVEETSAYPEWEYRTDSPLREDMVSVYREMYQKEPEINIIHAGLECGVFAEKIKDFDAVSFGPDILDIHTTKERLNIESANRVWEFLVRLLEK